MPNITRTALKHARESAGYTLERLAAEIHEAAPQWVIGPSTLADYEAGHMNKVMECLYGLILGEVE